ncbi:MAG: hypothetical protein DRQ43_04055 [Gammaproteobacteria bacterium]|nr:MAG: hypothetical protein DRQ43_04055 [Gammaproteobacteria bacterium]
MSLTQSKNYNTRTAAINLRALPEQRTLIDKAAKLMGKTRSEFILEASCQSAEDILLDQRLFFLDDADYNAFEALLNAPVKDNPALKKLMAKKAPWEK